MLLNTLSGIMKRIERGIKKVIFAAPQAAKVLIMKCVECGSPKIGYDSHGIKYCKDCGIVVEEWM